MPSASPPSDMTFSVRSLIPIMMNVARMASGIETPMMNVLRKDLRKRRTTSIARMAPPTAASFTEFSASRMKPDWS